MYLSIIYVYLVDILLEEMDIKIFPIKVATDLRFKVLELKAMTFSNGLLKPLYLIHSTNIYQVTTT